MTYEYTISQIDERLPGAELYVYSHWEEVQKLGGFKPELYVEVAHGTVTKDISSHAVCEMLYTEFNSVNPPEKLLRNFSVSRGDMVYARYKANGGGYVRRVQGMPGDLIDVREDGKYLVVRENGLPAYEIALGDAPALVYGEIPSGAYLLLADDLSARAADGRTLGLTFETEIIAAPGAVLWPPRRAFRAG